MCPQHHKLCCEEKKYNAPRVLTPGDNGTHIEVQKPEKSYQLIMGKILEKEHRDDAAYRISEKKLPDVHKPIRNGFTFLYKDILAKKEIRIFVYIVDFDPMGKLPKKE